MKLIRIFTLSLIMIAELNAGWVPSPETQDSIKYHGTQFLAGATVGLIGDMINEVIPSDPENPTRDEIKIKGLVNMAGYITILNVPDRLNQTAYLKPLAEKQKLDTGRWAYFLGMHARIALRNLYK